MVEKKEQVTSLNYERIEKAILYIKKHFKEKLSLSDIAQSVHISPFHFQRLFQDWAGVSPKQFIHYTRLAYAKKLFIENKTSLFEIALSTGFSGSSRLHDVFVKIEAMSPGEYKNGGISLQIEYGFYTCMFGNICIASTRKGIYKLAFYKSKTEIINGLRSELPNAFIIENRNELHLEVLNYLRFDNIQAKSIKLHLKASPFKLKVWESLLNIPEGKLSTYGNVAKQIGSPLAPRAVGTAIGKNPIAILIPCHRVIQSNGGLGEYMWGKERKAGLIAFEISKSNKTIDDGF